MELASLIKRGRKEEENSVFGTRWLRRWMEDVYMYSGTKSRVDDDDEG